MLTFQFCPVIVCYPNTYITFCLCPAQKIGLIEAPKAGLTESDWKAVKHISQNRGDSTQPCVICKEDFELREQVCIMYVCMYVCMYIRMYMYVCM